MHYIPAPNTSQYANTYFKNRLYFTAFTDDTYGTQQDAEIIINGTTPVYLSSYSAYPSYFSNLLINKTTKSTAAAYNFEVNGRALVKTLDITFSNGSDAGNGLYLNNTGGGSAGIRLTTVKGGSNVWQLFAGKANNNFRLGRSSKFDAITIDNNSGSMTLHRDLTVPVNLIVNGQTSGAIDGRQWVPAMYNITNFSYVVFNAATYQKTNDVVDMKLRINCNMTGSVYNSFEFTLPFAKPGNFVTTNQCRVY